jgi:hypothetical protein
MKCVHSDQLCPHKAVRVPGAQGRVPKRQVVHIMNKHEVDARRATPLIQTCVGHVVKCSRAGGGQEKCDVFHKKFLGLECMTGVLMPQKISLT